ncbi:hypothetical protein TUN199_11793, partial [Pyrenophora tritici-repentis]
MQMPFPKLHPQLAEPENDLWWKDRNNHLTTGSLSFNSNSAIVGTILVNERAGSLSSLGLD